MASAMAANDRFMCEMGTQSWLHSIVTIHLLYNKPAVMLQGESGKITKFISVLATLKLDIPH